MKYLNPKIIYKILLLLLILAFDKTASQAQNLNAYQKAEKILELVDFVYWPAKADMANRSTPFRIVVVGDDLFADSLRLCLKKTYINGKIIEITDKNPIENEYYHIVFYKDTSSQTTKTPQIINTINSLTVTDAKPTILKPVIVYIKDSKEAMPFLINEKILRASGLEISHMIMAAVEIIEPYND